MTPVPTTDQPSGLGWPVDVSRETSEREAAVQPGSPSGLGWPQANPERIDDPAAAASVESP